MMKILKFLIYKGSSVMDEISGINAQIYNEKNRNYIYFNLKKSRGDNVEILAFCSDFWLRFTSYFLKIEKKSAR